MTQPKTEMHPHYWNDAQKHLSRQCPIMKRLISQYKGEALRARGNGFYTLLRSVVGQQISVKAADFTITSCVAFTTVK